MLYTRSDTYKEHTVTSSVPDPHPFHGDTDLRFLSGKSKTKNFRSGSYVYPYPGTPKMRIWIGDPD